MKRKREAPFASAVAGIYFQRLFCVFALQKLKLDPSLKKIKIKLLSAEFDRTFALVANALFFSVFFNFIEAGEIMDIFTLSVILYSFLYVGLLVLLLVIIKLTLLQLWGMRLFYFKGVDAAYLFEQKRSSIDHVCTVLLTGLILIITFWRTDTIQVYPEPRISTAAFQTALFLFSIFAFLYSSKSTRRLKREIRNLNWSDFKIGVFITVLNILISILGLYLISL